MAFIMELIYVIKYMKKVLLYLDPLFYILCGADLITCHSFTTFTFLKSFSRHIMSLEEIFQ